MSLKRFLPHFLRTWVTKTRTLAQKDRKKKRGKETVGRFRCNDPDALRSIPSKYGFSGDLLEIIAKNEERPVHKWHHYIPIYDRHLRNYRNQPVRFLEIGVSKGGSLAVWRKYLGDSAMIFGIDIDDRCRKLDGIDGAVRIGSQDDEKFLEDVVSEMGGIDVVLDDGSHRMEHISKSLEVLFPLLSNNGLYIIEDLHAAYWKRFGGGMRSKANFFNIIRPLIDDMHHWYHEAPRRLPHISRSLVGIHVYDSIVVLDKNEVHPPRHSIVPPT